MKGRRKRGGEEGKYGKGGRVGKEEERIDGKGRREMGGGEEVEERREVGKEGRVGGEKVKRRREERGKSRWKVMKMCPFQGASAMQIS